LISEEVQGSQSNPKQQLGVVKGVQPSFCKQALLSQLGKEVVVDLREEVAKEELGTDSTGGDGSSEIFRSEASEVGSKGEGKIIGQSDGGGGGGHQGEPPVYILSESGGAMCGT
jgi:hypothetical protein